MSETPEAGSPRFLAWLYSTPSQQPVLASLCSIEREIDASVRPGVDHHVAHSRLEWWREECARCAAGEPVHPLTRELLTHLRQLAPATAASSALAGLSGLVDAAIWDLASATFERRQELTAYCRRWAAAMIGPLAAAAAGPAGDLIELGVALHELELLGRLAADAALGRVRIPLDELAQAAVSPQALATPPWAPELVAILHARHQALRQQLAKGVASLASELQRSARGILVWAALAAQASVRAERALPRPANASVAGAAAANWRAWRAARAAAAGRLRLS